jgi:hypothetical protein
MKYIHIKGDSWEEDYRLYSTWEFAIPRNVAREGDASFVGVI